jgi:hypothetical protein
MGSKPMPPYPTNGSFQGLLELVTNDRKGVVRRLAALGWTPACPLLDDQTGKAVVQVP